MDECEALPASWITVGSLLAKVDAEVTSKRDPSVVMANRDASAKGQPNIDLLGFRV